jgi:predicted lipid-binding transport protein (Tim44 family)
MSDTTPPTAAQNTSPRAQPWTTRSKKEMFLGLIIIIAGIGTEPVFLRVTNTFGLFSLFIMLVGVYIAVLGYLEQR